MGCQNCVNCFHKTENASEITSNKPIQKTITSSQLQSTKHTTATMPSSSSASHSNMPSYTSSTQFEPDVNLPLQTQILALINNHRSYHNVNPLTYNVQIESIAQRFAESLCQKEQLLCSNNEYKNEPLGECLFACNDTITAKKIVDSWYNEIRKYNWSKRNDTAGNFTQIVWKDSKEFGFGYAKSKGGIHYMVGNFFPAGNYVGEHERNVFPRRDTNSGNVVCESRAGNNVNNAGSSSNTHGDQFETQKQKLIAQYNNFYEDGGDVSDVDGKKQTAIQHVNVDNNNNCNNNTANNSNNSNDDVENEALQCHNDYRNKHHAPPLTINKELSAIAQQYADYLAKNDIFEHSDNKYKNNPLGENLYMCSGTAITGKSMTTSWYNEIKDYDFTKPGFSMQTGHFTQVIWKSTTQMGIGYAKSESGNYYGVANYYPAGNFTGEFKQNVLNI